MEVSREVRLDRFARWAKEAVRVAHAGGMADRDMERVTGLKPRTWQRWQAKDFGPEGPQVNSVNRFCDGLEIPRSIPYGILGWAEEVAGQPAAGKAECELPPDVREILRRLGDPNTPEAERVIIRGTLRALASRPQPPAGATRRSRKG